MNQEKRQNTIVRLTVPEKGRFFLPFLYITQDTKTISLFVLKAANVCHVVMILKPFSIGLPDFNAYQVLIYIATLKLSKCLLFLMYIHTWASHIRLSPCCISFLFGRSNTIEETDVYNAIYGLQLSPNYQVSKYTVNLTEVDPMHFLLLDKGY